MCGSNQGCENCEYNDSGIESYEDCPIPLSDCPWEYEIEQDIRLDKAEQDWRYEKEMSY